MPTVSKRMFKGRWYVASFLLLLVPVAEIWYLSGHPGGLPKRFLVISWATSGAAGLVCAFIGSGGLNKKSIDDLGTVALILHTMSLGLLMVVEMLGASAP